MTKTISQISQILVLSFEGLWVGSYTILILRIIPVVNCVLDIFEAIFKSGGLIFISQKALFDVNKLSFDSHLGNYSSLFGGIYFYVLYIHPPRYSRKVVFIYLVLFTNHEIFQNPSSLHNILAGTFIQKVFSKSI